MAKSPYKRQLKDYADTYNVSPKTVGRWAKRGYPLDDEQATREIAAGIRPVPFGHSQAATTAAPAPEGKAAQGGALGMGAANQRLREAEAKAHADYQTADDKDRPWKRSEWLELAEALRKAEKDSPEIAAANNEAVRIAEVSLELAGLFRNLRSDLEALGKRLAPTLVGKDALDIKEAIDREAALIVAGLFDAKYLRGITCE